MANEFRIDYIYQMRAFREKKLEMPEMTAGMVSVYYALLDINNQSQWSEEFDVDFGYIIALSKVDKTTYYKAMDFFLEHGILLKYTKGLNAYTRAKATLCVLYEKSTGKSLGKSDTESLGESLGESASDHHYNKTINNKLKKETIEDLFNEFWILYDKKTGKAKTLKKWLLLTDVDRSEILKAIPRYVKSTPDKKFRKDALTYLNGNHWEDEIIDDQKGSSTTIPLSTYKFGAKPIGQTNHN